MHHIRGRAGYGNGSRAGAETATKSNKFDVRLLTHRSLIYSLTSKDARMMNNAKKSLI